MFITRQIQFMNFSIVQIEDDCIINGGQGSSFGVDTGL